MLRSEVMESASSLLHLLSRLTLVVLILFARVSVIAEGTDEALAARIKMIQFAAQHFLPAINSYFWSLTLDRAAGKPVDPYEYALAREYFGFFARDHYQPPVLRSLFKFVQDSEFKVVNIEPDRIAIRQPDGFILWNLEKLASLENFTVIDAMKILLHELNHLQTQVDIRPDDGLYRVELLFKGEKKPERSDVAKTLSRQAQYYRKYSAILPIDLSQKDKFASKFAAFLESRSTTAQDPSGVHQLWILNLLLNTNQNEQVEVFQTGKSHHIYNKAFLGWSTAGPQKFHDETEKLAILYETFGRTKVLAKEVSNESDGYRIGFSKYSADIQPDVQIQSISIQDQGQVKIDFTTLNQPIFVNDAGLSALEHLDRQPFPGMAPLPQPAKAHFILGEPLSGDVDPTLNASLEFSYRSTLPAVTFKLNDVVEQENERLYKLTVTGMNVPAAVLDRPILVCTDHLGQKYTFAAEAIQPLGDQLSLTFKVGYPGALTVSEIVWPSWASTAKTKYIEYVARAQTQIKIQARPNAATGKALPTTAFRVDQVQFETNGNLLLNISAGAAELKQINSLLIELGHFKKHLVSNMKVEGYAPYWTQLIGEKISISSTQLQSFIKAHTGNHLELSIPIQQLSALSKEAENRGPLKITNTGERSLSGVSLITRSGLFVKLNLEKETFFDPLSAKLLEESRNPKPRSAEVDRFFEDLARRFKNQLPQVPVPKCRHLFKR